MNYCIGQWQNGRRRDHMLSDERESSRKEKAGDSLFLVVKSTKGLAIMSFFYRFAVKLKYFS